MVMAAAITRFPRLVSFHYKKEMAPNLAWIWGLCSFSSSSEWILPRCDEVSPSEFRQAAASAAPPVRRIAFLRHGNTAPSPTGADFDRVLTDLGRDQSRQAGRAFGAEMRPYRKVLVSPAPRTVETAQLFLQEAKAAAAAVAPAATGASVSAGLSSTADLSLVPGLYDGAMQPEGSALFRRLGYAPLRAYVEAEDPADRDAARRVLGQYAALVAREVHRHLRQLGGQPRSPPQQAASLEPVGTLLVVGHAIYLPAAALGVAELCGCSKNERDVLLDTDTQEAQGYCVDLCDSSVTLLSR
jgi:broad specificity phosphatase PhoE